MKPGNTVYFVMGYSVHRGTITEISETTVTVQSQSFGEVSEGVDTVRLDDWEVYSQVDQARNCARDKIIKLLRDLHDKCERYMLETIGC